MQDLILHYDLAEESVGSIQPMIELEVNGQTVKMTLTMCYWRPDFKTYHLEYRQMED